MRSKIAMVVAGVVVAGIAGWLVSWNGPRLEVVNETRVKQFGVSWWRWRMYAHNMGYTKQEAKKIRVVFTDTRQSGYELWSGGKLLETLGAGRQGEVAEVYINYQADQFDGLKNRPDWWEADVLAGICQIMGGPTTSYEGCYRQAREYQTKMERWKLGRLVSGGWVTQAYAQSCSGIIKCGTEVNKCELCSDGMPCIHGDKCSDETVCKCNKKCDLNLGNDLNCNRIKNENVCNNESAPYRQCGTSCNKSAENYCNWGTPPSEPPPELPPELPGCNVVKVTPVETDCSRSGLRGTYTEKGAITAQTYSCGPRAYNPAFSCGYWKATWEGYFVPPEAGEYEFLVDTYPRAGMGIDLNDDGVMNGNCGLGEMIASAAIVGDKSYVADTRACDIWYRPKWLRMDLEFGVDKHPTCGAEGCWNTRPADEDELWEGGHCGGFDNNEGWFGDVNEWFTPVGSSYPLVPGLSTPAANSSWDKYGGECIYNTALNGQIDYGINGDGAIYKEGGSRFGGRTRLWVKRNFPEVRAYKVSFWYGYHYENNKSHSMEFYYRKVGQPSFIRALDQVDSACPFKPCDVCDSEPPEAPTLTGPADGYSVRETTNSPVLEWHFNGNWGLGCGAAVNNFEVCVANTEEAAKGFSGCVFQTVVGSGAGSPHHPQRSSHSPPGSPSCA